MPYPLSRFASGMKSLSYLTLSALLLLLVSPSFSVFASNSEELLAAYEHIVKPDFDSCVTRSCAAFDLTHEDLVIHFDSGTISFLPPVVIDGEDKYWGARYSGSCNMSFTPTPPLEKMQMQRFFESDSLTSTLSALVLYFNDSIYNQLMQASSDSVAEYTHPGGGLDRVHELLSYKEYADRYAHILRNVARQSEEPFLMVYCDQGKRSRNDVIYEYNPLVWERVTFHRFYRFLLSEWEMVCSYEPPSNPKRPHDFDDIRIHHYDIDASISRGADYDATVAMTIEVLQPSVNIEDFHLGPEIDLDSIVFNNSHKVDFVRKRIKDDDYGEIHVLFDSNLVSGDTVTLTFFLSGEIAERLYSEYLFPVANLWYPSVNSQQYSTYDVKFAVPDDIDIVSMGELVSETTDRNRTTTHWRCDEPIKAFAFSMGHLSHYDFHELGIPLQVSYAEDLHRDLSISRVSDNIPSGRHMERQVSGDIIGAVQLFSRIFGPYPYDKLVVTENVSHMGQAFRAMLQLSIDSWSSTDMWGESRIFRAHEAAHQWWGGTVYCESYHDQWLSEGFSEYSALFYLQTVAGSKIFYYQLEQYRKSIMNARKYVLGPGHPPASVTLGYRNNTSETPGDYDRVVYQKGAFILHMLRNMLLDLDSFSEDRFCYLLWDWFEKHRFQEVTTDQFQAHCERHYGQELDWFFDQWVSGIHLPVYRFDYDLEKNDTGLWIAHCTVKQEDVPDDFKMFVPVEIVIDKRHSEYQRVLIEGPETTFDLSPTEKKPRKIELNPFESVLCKVK